MDGIVIGIDESASSLTALRWAVREAAVRDWPLTAVLGWGTLDRHCVVLGERFRRGYDLQDADDALLAIIEAGVGIEAARPIRRRVVCDDGAHALLAAAADADLLVVGARGTGGFADLPLGSVAETCLHHAPCPVAVVRPPARSGRGTRGDDGATSPARVIVGVDGSPAAQVALRWAIGEASAHRAVLEVLHVCQPPGLTDTFALSSPDPADVEAADKLARHMLDGAIDAEDVSGLPQAPLVTVALGSPAATVLEIAQRPDLVVLGSRGRGGFAELRLGSVGHQVARHAPCPVVVVPDGS